MDAADAAQRLVVRFPHGAEVVPAQVDGRPVRFATIDRDGSLVLWMSEDMPELITGYGAWVGRSGADSVKLGRVCSGSYPAYRDALRMTGLDRRGLGADGSPDPAG